MLRDFVWLALWIGLVAAPAAARAEATGFLAREVKVGGETFHYQVYVPPRPAGDLLPVILYLHGAGGMGTDGQQTKTALGQALRENSERFPFIVVFPLARLRWVVPQMEELALAALDRSLAELHGDPDRVYLVGYSVGAAGAWRIASLHRERFAALVAIAGMVHSAPKLFTTFELTADQKTHAYLAAADPFAALAARLAGLPVVVFHGAADEVVPPAESRGIVAALQGIAGASIRYTEYPDAGHGEVVGKALADVELWGWLAAQRRGPLTKR